MRAENKARAISLSLSLSLSLYLSISRSLDDYFDYRARRMKPPILFHRSFLRRHEYLAPNDVFSRHCWERNQPLSSMRVRSREGRDK
jgi:hypothetical protein